MFLTNHHKHESWYWMLHTLQPKKISAANTSWPLTAKLSVDCPCCLFVEDLFPGADWLSVVLDPGSEDVDVWDLNTNCLPSRVNSLAKLYVLCSFRVLTCLFETLIVTVNVSITYCAPTKIFWFSSNAPLFHFNTIGVMFFQPPFIEFCFFSWHFPLVAVSLMSSYLKNVVGIFTAYLLTEDKTQVKT